jgi:hypothetical protein|uniref:hypothetical protein n=1 Tax=Orrella sp. TaxID=1921583 RepID=UPI00404790D4
MPVSGLFDDAQHAYASPEELPHALRQRCHGDWVVQGRGLFTWSVFRVYEVSLLVQQPLSASAIETGFNTLAPFALDLNYLRNVSAAQIAQTSVAEMIRLTDVDPIRAVQWGQQLSAVLPDVGLGDRLIGLFEPNHAVTFFSNDQYLGGVVEPDFVPAFASVWLDPETKAPALRAALLNLSAQL